MNLVKLYICDLQNIKHLDFKDIPYVLEEDILNANRFKFAEDQYQHIISSYFKRKYAPDYSIGHTGKPISSMTHISISHSHNLVICATNENAEIGVDIELIKKSEERLRKYVANDDEYEFIKTDEDFFRIWTSKESIGKCYGTGISTNLKEIPAMPLNGRKSYLDELYYSKNIKYGDYIISVTLRSDEDFELEKVIEVITKKVE